MYEIIFIAFKINVWPYILIQSQCLPIHSAKNNNKNTYTKTLKLVTVSRVWKENTMTSVITSLPIHRSCVCVCVCLRMCACPACDCVGVGGGRRQTQENKNRERERETERERQREFQRRPQRGKDSRGSILPTHWAAPNTGHSTDTDVTHEFTK